MIAQMSDRLLLSLGVIGLVLGLGALVWIALQPP